MPPPTTPCRLRSRSEAKTPLTPSIISGFGNVSLATSPTKKSTHHGLKSKKSTGVFDPNPFLTTQSRSRPPSRPSSPTKKSSAERQTVGVIRKGGVESRLDVVTRDYVPPPKSELKRSKSTPATVCILSHFSPLAVNR